MRLHRVGITAFGPFAGTEEVDLDALSEAGLFLLHGPTGAGKSTVLDAVCFALFGVVPGARAGVTRLRSDHAADGVAPQVTCELSVGDRRFEVTRSPAWERPKKRGTGTTTEQARVLLRERRDDGWQPLTSRVDEAAHLLEEVLGLGPEQFTKLVLLPQGEFAAFLRADAETRRSVLERLFGTDRFADVQQWLREQAQELRREVEAATSGTGQLVARAEQVAASVGVQVPVADPAADGGTDPVEDPLGHLQVLAAGVARETELAVTSREVAAGRLRTATHAHRQGLDLQRRQAEAAELAVRARRLAEAQPAHERRTERLGASGRAAALAPLVAPLRGARQRHGAAVAAHAAARPALAAVPTDLRPPGTDPDATAPAAGVSSWSDDEVAAVAARARDLVAELRAVEQESARYEELRLRHDEAVRREELAGERAAASATALAASSARLEEVTAEQSAAAVRAAGLPGAQAALDAARSAAEALVEADRLDDEAAALGVRGDDLRRRRDDARERWLDLRERRLDGMAAELAAGLREDEPCPVCGSAEHPRPAAPARPGVDEEAEREAHEAADEAAAAVAAVEAELAAVRARLEAARQAAGGTDPESVQRALLAAQALVTELVGVQRRVRSLDAELEHAREGLAAARLVHERATRDLRTASERLTAARELLAAAAERAAVARGTAPDVPGRQAAAEAAVAACEAELAARGELASASAHLAHVTAAAAGAAAEAGFGSLEEALAAVLGEPERAELAEAVRAHEAEAAAVADRAVDRALAAAADTAPADVAALATAQELAHADDEAAANRLHLCLTARDALVLLDQQVRAHLEDYRPLLERHVRVAELARCLDGTGGGNTRRMPLSSYVLAARLEQVAQAASLRLAEMSSGRYTLVHSDEAGRGRGRSGLALRVVDGWTGRHRDTATLSGGESFYASLALALGLADVVTAEAGGTTIETLFVDEGFGSLDDETLEEVMDVLDALRSGGRAVGLVSHVPDLRTRIPAQLEVVKTRTGSTLRQAIA